ncbi:MAG TPA: multiheme c-type cytochrome [Labilithrix sp.]|nr:multiheme c-type cytochrome [Labilithrix sp.]
MRRIVFLALIVAACAGSGKDPSPVSHPDVQGSDLERSAACEGCHADIALEWRASLHMQSYSDPVYQRAFALEPLAFCTRCHAPLADPEAPSGEPAAVGIACTSCHSGGPTVTSTRPCADCHEFGFPEGPGLMQLTATEHRASVHSATPCATCHMPRVAGHASHRFSASRDVELLRGAADIRASRASSEVVVSLSPRNVGHALPTGDIFRRLRVDVSVQGDPATQHRIFLNRETKTGGPDSRPFVSGAPAEVRVPLAAPTAAIVWSVTYERVEHLVSPDGSDAVIDGSIELASGTLLP